MKYHDHLSLEEIWARVLLEFDVLHDAVQSNTADLSATDHKALLLALAALRQAGPLAPTSSNHIGDALSILENAVSRETLGHQNIFDGIHDPEIGAIGRVKSEPILSEKGAELDVHLRNFRTVLAMCDLLTARVDAELQIAHLKAA